MAADDPTQIVVRGTARTRPVDAPPPLDVFIKPPRIEQAALSPDGAQVAFVTWLEGYHVLVTYRVSDMSKRVAKLNPGTVSAISWADDNHVLVSSTRTGLRGTCEGAVQSGRDSSSSHINRPETDTAKEGSTAEAMAQLSLMSSVKTPGCVYYGVRAQTAVTSVNISERAGINLGTRLSEYANLALGAPEPVMMDGKVQLVGPYLELRPQPVGGQPTQSVYLWRSDPETGLGKLVNDGGGDLNRERRYVDDWLLDRQGHILARSVYNFTAEQFTIERRVDGKWKPVLTRKIETRATTFAPFMAGLGRDGQSIVIFDAGPESTGLEKRFHYYELSPTGKLSPPLEPDDATRDRPVFHPDTGRLAGFVRNSDAPEYSLSDTGLDHLYRLAQDAAPGQAVKVVSTARDPRRMIIFVQGGDEPGAYYFIDFAAGQTHEIGDIHPDVPSEWVASQKVVSYKAADGLAISALLTLPPKPEARRLPLVVLPHDGPQGHDSRGFDWLAQALASRGYLVLQPNYRGSDGYGQAFLAAGRGQWGRLMQSDLSDGIAYLAAQGLADPARVCVVGVGYGGYAALRGAEGPDTWRCAASIDGISDISEYVGWKRAHRPAPDPDLMAGLVADPEWPRAFSPDPGGVSGTTAYLGDAKDWAALSPINRVADVRSPVLLVHQSGDAAVSVNQSRQMRDALKGAGKVVTYVEVPGDDHDLKTEATRKETAQAVLDFLSAYNPAN